MGSKSLPWQRYASRVPYALWTVHCGAGGPGFESRGEPPIFNPPYLRRYSRNKKGDVGVTVKENKLDEYSDFELQSR